MLTQVEPGCIWASAGYDVRIRDPSQQQRADGIEYIQENVQAYCAKTGKVPGSFEAFEDMKDAVSNAWLVIEAVPEKIGLKIATFAELEALAPEDCILASNSSSYKSSEMISNVSDATKRRILNMHYYMPPQCMIVELMTDGYTSPEIFPFMVERSKEAATIPYVARKESTGFIFNRLWAAVKREVLTILAEGVSVPEEIDAMWLEMFVKGASLPCKMMDSKSSINFCVFEYLLLTDIAQMLVWTPLLSLRVITCMNVDCPGKRQLTFCKKIIWTMANWETSLRMVVSMLLVMHQVLPTSTQENPRFWFWMSGCQLPRLAWHPEKFSRFPQMESTKRQS
jgi:hypothetical protein